MRAMNSDARKRLLRLIAATALKITMPMESRQGMEYSSGDQGGQARMKIGVPKEIKTHEYRVGMTPASVKAYVKSGHSVMVEKGAGVGSGYEDAEYTTAGARIVGDKRELFTDSEMIVKVKEPLADEYPLFREGQILFTYLHLAACKDLAQELLKRKIAGVAYETIELPDRSLPCLTPMSEIAGRLSVQEGAKYLEKEFGGRGILLGGVPGVQRGKVAVLGGGVVGTNACKIAVGIGATVTVLDINAKRLAYLDDIFGSSITTLYATEANIESVLRESDIVIGAVLVAGETAPRLITRQHLSIMQHGAVIVDVAIDQGGCAETSRPTTHENPIYIVDNVVHYCVANMPGAVARSSTIALTSVTLPYGLMIANHGLAAAAKANEALRKGINTIDGKCVHPGVAKSCGLPYTQYN
jgi:alanine dehydrogenase